MIPLDSPHRIPYNFYLQFKQNTGYINFIESFYLKYGIYKPRKGEKSYKETHACARLINSIWCRV